MGGFYASTPPKYRREGTKGTKKDLDRGLSKPRRPARFQNLFVFFVPSWLSFGGPDSLGLVS
jgi:hypothetical protein